MAKSERRSLVDGLQSVDRSLEEQFVYQSKGGQTVDEEPATAGPVVSEKSSTATQSRSPLTTRIRADYAGALKRASLERQLSGETPNTVQEILEEALEPWLRSNGYLK